MQKNVQATGKNNTGWKAESHFTVASRLEKRKKSQRKTFFRETKISFSKNNDDKSSSSSSDRRRLLVTTIINNYRVNTQSYIRVYTLC